MTVEPIRVRHPGLTEPLVPSLDVDRSVWGMWLFIASEATLFGCLFMAYYYLAKGARLPGVAENPRWLVEEPPALKFAIPMLIVLMLSSLVLHLGEKAHEKLAHGAARLALAGTIVLGCGFLVLSYFEYRDHFQHLLPKSNAYGSIFYTITSLHLAHLILGLLLLLFVLLLPRHEPVHRPPHRAYHAAAMYWHFVDTIWLLVVTLLYIVPNLRT